MYYLKFIMIYRPLKVTFLSKFSVFKVLKVFNKRNLKRLSLILIYLLE